MQLDSAKNTILVVDDFLEVREILFELLKSAGYNVLLAENGDKAFECLDGLEIKSLPELILLDIIMPGPDGYEVCGQLKEHSHYRDIPVIFFTGLTDEKEIVRGFKAGGVDYITKPFFMEELLARVNTHIELYQARNEIRMLRGILPICPACKKVHNDKGYWESVELYLESHSSTIFSHSFCPDCKKSYYNHYVY